MLPATGPISISQVSVELGRASNYPTNMGEAAVRTLFGIPSGTIDMNTGHGKSALEYLSSSQTQNTANSSTLVINKPAGVVDGCLMIAVICSQSGSGGWTGDTGWTEVGTDYGAFRLAYKIAASEGASYSFAYDASPALHSGAILAFKGGAYDITGSTNSFSNPMVAPSVNAASASSILLAIYMDSNALRTFTTPTGMTPLISDANSNNPSYAIFTQAIGAGATGTRSSDSSGGPFGVSALLVVKPG